MIRTARYPCAPFISGFPFNDLAKISIILEFIAGRVTTTLDRLIALYRPDSVVVGMRGRGRVLGFGGRPGGMFSGKSHLLPWRLYSQEPSQEWALYQSMLSLTVRSRSLSSGQKAK